MLLLIATVAVLIPIKLSAVLPEIVIDDKLINAVNSQLASNSVFDIFKIDFGKLIEVLQRIELPDWVGEVFPNLLPKIQTTTTSLDVETTGGYK